jgi:hypothetical protein
VIDVEERALRAFEQQVVARAIRLVQQPRHVRDQRLDALGASLHRIANLQVRGAAELLERGDWKRIASELQAVAQEALGTPSTTRPAHRDED